ncbi:hypothetical protein Landi51_07370 [Colletotrichum acutatum]
MVHRGFAICCFHFATTAKASYSARQRKTYRILRSVHVEDAVYATSDNGYDDVGHEEQRSSSGRGRRRRCEVGAGMRQGAAAAAGMAQKKREPKAMIAVITKAASGLSLDALLPEASAHENIRSFAAGQLTSAESGAAVLM